MASIRRKSAAVALAVVGIAGLTLASAAQLNINSASLGAGTEVVASCDADGIDVGFETAFASTTYNATDVNLTNIDAACAGLDISIQLTDGGVAVGGEVNTTLAPTATFDGTFTAALTTPYDAELIDGVSIVIYG